MGNQRHSTLRALFTGIALAAVTFVGGAARADSYSERVQAGLRSGKDYVAAVEAASRASPVTYTPREAAEAKATRAALASGKNYADAWGSAGRGSVSASDEERTRQQRVRNELAMGKDYTDAIAAAARADESRAEPAASSRAVRTAAR